MNKISNRLQRHGRGNGYSMLASGVAAAVILFTAAAVVGYDVANKNRGISGPAQAAQQTTVPVVASLASR